MAESIASPPRKSWGRPWIGVISAALLVLSGVFVYRFLEPLPAESATIPLPPPPQLNAVYLPDPRQPRISTETARSFNLRIAVSVSDLKAEAATADAIVLDDGSFDLVDPVWLGQELQQGKVVAALNVPIRRIAQLPGHESVGSGDTSNYIQASDRLFFSLHRQMEENGVRYSLTESDYVVSPASFLRYVYGATPAGVAADRAAHPAPTPAH